MSTVELRRETKSLIDTLSGPQLRVVSEFLAFIKDRRTDAASRELLATPGFAESFAKGMADVRAGRTTPWRSVRSDV